MASLLPGESDTNPGGSLIDESVIVAAMLPALHADTIAHLIFWLESELIEWIDAAVKKLARTAGVFIGRSIGTNTVIGTGTYAVPSDHLSTIHASFNTSPLREASAGDLDAQNPAYLTAQGTPKRWFQDKLGLSTIGYAPVPDSVHATWLIYHGLPQTVDAAKVHTTIPLPWVLEDYVELSVLAEAYSKEGDGYAPDIAATARQIAGIYEAAAVGYWGTAE